MATANQIAHLRIAREIASVGRARALRRPRRRRIPPQRFPTAIRLRYAKGLREFVDRLQDLVRREVIAKLPGIFAALPADLRLDAPADGALRELMRRAGDQAETELLGGEITTLPNAIAHEVSAWNRTEFGAQMKVALGIDPFVADPHLADQVDGFVSENVALIRSIATDQLGKVGTIVHRALNSGARVEVVAKEIEQSFGVSSNRAMLIATDQVSKLDGQLTASRQQQVGITEYTWSSSQDERVRPGHRDLNGTRQSWKRPPVENPKTGARGHPRQPIRCRCDAIPVVDDLLEQLGILGPDGEPAAVVRPPAPVRPPKPASPPPATVEAAKAAQSTAAARAAATTKAADELALTKAREAAAAKKTAASSAAAQQVEAAKAKAAAYKAKIEAEAKAKNVAAAKQHREAFEALVANKADPQATLKALKAIAQTQPEVFAELYNDVVKGGKGLGGKFLTNLPKTASTHAKKVLTKLGMSLEPPAPAAPKWTKPYPQPVAVDLSAYEFKVVPGDQFEWHDIYAHGQKLAYVKKYAGDTWVVDPPANLKAKGWEKLSWPENDKALATNYALEVSKAIKGGTGDPFGGFAADVAKAAAKPAKPAVPARSSIPTGSAWSKSWGGRRAIKPGKAPGADLAKRWNPGRGGVGIAGDGDWIEDFAIQFQQEFVDGVPELVARFKINQHRSLDFFSALQGRTGVKTRKSVQWRQLAGAEKAKPNVLEKMAPTSSSTVGVDNVVQAKVGSAQVTAARQAGETGATISGRVSDLSALHNAVEVRVPFTGDLAKDYGEFAKAMGELGVDVTAGPSAAQLKAWKQAKLLAAGDSGTMRLLHDMPQRTPEAIDAVFTRATEARPWLREWLEDVELIESTPGKVSPYSKKIAQAMEESGVTHLTHNASRGAGDLLEAMLVQDNQQSGLLSSRERFNRGIFTTGMSTERDFQTGGADSVFTRIQTHAPATAPSAAGTTFEIDPSELGRLDTYTFNGDRFGKVGPAALGERLGARDIMDRAKDGRGFNSGNEAMFRHSVPVTSIRRVTVSSQSERQRVIERLKGQGVEEVNGMPLEEWIVSGGRS